MTAMIPSPALDLSRYQPGDVLILSDHDICRMGNSAIELMRDLRGAARRAGLDIRVEMDLMRAEYRFTFSQGQP